MNIQHDAYKSLVQNILSKLERLRTFALNNEEDIQVCTYTLTYLCKRGIAQRRLYERSILDTTEETSGDKVYKS